MVRVCRFVKQTTFEYMEKANLKIKKRKNWFLVTRNRKTAMQVNLSKNPVTDSHLIQ
tara:strand:+ start:751 stop:921 length:171 start_codon:yes stop_codon:yes gene_type:complete